MLIIYKGKFIDDGDWEKTQTMIWYYITSRFIRFKLKSVINYGDESSNTRTRTDGFRCFALYTQFYIAYGCRREWTPLLWNFCLFLSLSLSLFFDTYIHIHIPRRASLSTLSLTLDSIETKLIAKHNIKINCSQLVISPFFDFVYISQTNNFISLRIMVKTRKIGSATQRNRYFVPDDRSRIATWRIRIWICTQWSLDPPYIRVYISPPVSPSSETIPL